jgi:hypothetical protein
MKYRVGAWASVGFLIASFWTLYLFPTSTAVAEPILMLARITSPAAFASSYLHVDIRFYWIVLANTAAYALLGLTIEALRFAYRPSTQI